MSEYQFNFMKPHERFINHSCDPNVFVKNWKIIAMRSIEKSEELVFDYSINSDFPVAFKCRCGARNCRGVFNITDEKNGNTH